MLKRSTKSSARRTKNSSGWRRAGLRRAGLYRGTFKITHREGLHTRPAARFVAVAQHFPAVIEVRRGKWKADGKSILGLLALGAKRGQELTITARGIRAKEAVQALTRFVRENL